MTRRRWIADRVEGGRAWLLGPNANHLFRVLRVKVGQEFDVAADGVLRSAKVVSASHDQVEFELGAEVESASLPQITVYLSIFKFDRLEWALEKLTELGVARVVPMIAQRTEEHLAKAAARRVERWRKIAREASQQARRVAPPEIADPVALKKAVLEEQGSRIVLAESEDQSSLKAMLAECPPPLALAFGPEGGWSEAELALFNAGGWKPASLGHTILRAETAAIAAVAVALAEMQTGGP
ncbi:MAG TPA: RsmE family RNA methyltransferase [Candidatus Angelobacter sp.]|jgi:16S rRNA (uracil1498-N3)-methyltransferase|nr:RsmE family RNA methyltransferase [Candidatus Angelobacter sp.]